MFASSFGSCSLHSGAQTVDHGFNQKGRRAILREIEKSKEKERSAPPKGAWGCEVAKVKLAMEIKEALFQAGGNDKPDEKGGDEKLKRTESEMPNFPNLFESGPEWVRGLESASENEEEDEKFGRNYEDLFSHSWRPKISSGWFWKPKPIWIGEEMYPAYKEDIRRYGHKAKKIARVPPPKPLDKPFVDIAKGKAAEWAAMSWDQQKGRWYDRGPGPQRRVEDESYGARSREDSNRRGWEEEDLREKMLRDRNRFESEGNRARQIQGDSDGFNREDPRRFTSQRGAESGWQRQGDPRREMGPGKTQFPPREIANRESGPSWLGGGDDQKRFIKGKDLGTCYRCGEEGHHQATCKKEPFCYKCGNTGHMAYNCNQNLEPSLNLRGYGFRDQGFFSLKLPGAVLKQPTEHWGLLHVVSGEASSNKIEAELKHLIDNQWEWKVRQVAERDFIAIFPNKAILDTFSKSKRIELAIHNIVAQVSKADREIWDGRKLETGWVQIHKVPDIARTETAVKLVAELAGEVIVVDELSLIREGPVRVKLRAREIDKIRGNVEVFIEDQGVNFKFVPENPPNRSKFQKGESSKNTDEDHSEEEEEDEDNKLTEWEKMKREYEAKLKNETQKSSENTDQGGYKSRDGGKDDRKSQEKAKDDNNQSKDVSSDILTQRVDSLIPRRFSQAIEVE